MPVTARPARPSFSFARRNGATLLEWRGDDAAVAHRLDASAETLLELRRHLAAPMQFEPMSDQRYDELLQQLYQHGSGDARQMAEDLGDEIDLKQIAEELAEPEDLLESEDDAPIIRLINALLTEAVKENASDIHIEPLENRLMVRFRVDGVLREVLAPERRVASLVTSRIKIMARLDIAEKRLPQDGRISLRVAGRPVDVRVSTIPSSHGERLVLRLLDKQAGRLDLRQLGMGERALATLEQLITRPHGILLVTGPTGSGKTTTLYAALGRLNDRTRNIMTVEDPIEYDIDGIGQTQVNPRVEMDFARGLRAILRQDPDVVMVGEIRDLETAQIAVQASLTGHLVLATLHTNSAIGAVTRLRDMGVEPFLLASSLVGMLAQRLVRVLDPEHREAYQAGAAELAAFGQPSNEPVTLYRPTPGAPGGGYRGRTGIYELVAVDETLRGLIHDGAGEADLEQHARVHWPSLTDDGWRVVKEGQSSVDEVLRVTRQE
ncbi:MAG: type II secretion system ATPase GspE [Pseudomonadota bacterium]